jgi:hypothetical protein
VISGGRRKVGGTQAGHRLRGLRSRGLEDRRAEQVFVNREGEPGYVRARMGLLGIKTVLLPVQFVETYDDIETLVLM